MPYESTAQRGYLHVHEPELAKKWDKETPKGAKLPEHVSKDAADQPGWCESCQRQYPQRPGESCPGCGKPLGEKPEPTNPEKFMAEFNDLSRWKHVKGVPVFDLHNEVYQSPGPDGQPRNVEENFDLPRLQQIAANCNALVDSGNPIGLTAGHTRDDAAESAQPETLGWARNYRVAMHPTLQKPCVFHDEQYYPDKYETAKGLPFRSVERWRPKADDPGDYFRPVALLRREPRRKLGPVAYQRGGRTVVRYSMDYEPEAPAPVREYSMFEGVRYMADQPPQTPIPPAGANPTAPPQGAQAGGQQVPIQPVEDPTALEPSEKDKAIGHKIMYGHPVMGRICKYAEAHPEWPEQAVSAAPAAPAEPKAAPAEPAKNAAAPSGSNVGVPQLQPQKTEPMKMAADTISVERYQALEAEVRDLRKGERVARYAADFTELDRQGYAVNVAEELEKGQDRTQEQHDEHCANIRKYGAATRRPPANGRPIRLGGQPNRHGDGEEVPLTKEQMESALAFQAENPGVTMPQAIKYARTGEKPVRG